ncbi:MAG: phosphoenolpyruvate--protein phosphotransferase [Candidatus Aminicenantia bacterium]
MEYIRLKGIGVSPGIAVGEILLTEKSILPTVKETIPPSQVEKELNRFRKAIRKTEEQLANIKEKMKKKIGEEYSFIFDAHLLILNDPSLLREIEQLIKKEKVKTEWALAEVYRKYKKIFQSIEDDYFKQRGNDIKDVLVKINKNLIEKKDQTTKFSDKKRILVCHELAPSEAATILSRGNVLAVALDMGGQTSHTAILARSLNIPTIVGLHNLTDYVKNGDQLIVDGTAGEVIVNPPLAIIKEFLSKKQKYEDYQKELIRTKDLASITLDGIPFIIQGNIELPEELDLALSYGGEGIGLFRSEYLYLHYPDLPTEEKHFSTYFKVAKRAYPYPVVIRTVDIGGEKDLPHLDIEREPNPALGLRAIRLFLKKKKLFKSQLRAILRASVLKNVKILIPMVTELEEIKEFRTLLDEAKRELQKKKINFDSDIPIGIMIEVPAAATIADLLIKEVDFISIGTNDLIQYYLAVDRSNEFVSYLYQPFHPSILRVLNFVIGATKKRKKEVAVCGEMAADPLSALVLLGLGIMNFSMNPIFIPKVKRALRAVDYQGMRKIVKESLKLSTAQEIEEYILEQILKKYPDVFLSKPEI